MAAPIDTHVLIASSDLAAFPVAEEVDPRELTDSPKYPDVAALLDRGSLAGAVLVQRGRQYGFDNRLICAVAAADPRVRAICAVDGRNETCGDEAKRLLTLPGVAGLRLMEPAKGADLKWLCGPGATEAWRAAAECGAIMDVHVFPWNRATALPELARLAGEFPEVPVLIDNCGNIAVEEGAPRFGIDPLLERAAQRSQVSLKFSSMTLARLGKAGLHPGEAVAAFAVCFGAERLCWGSDVLAAGLTLEQAAEQARQAVSGLPAEKAEAILSGNAQALFDRRAPEHG